MKIVDLSIKAELIKYLKSNKLWAKKGLSQNFLVDKDALNQIIKSAELRTSDLVIEVGAGTGVLTQELVRLADKTIAIEFDNKLAELLNGYIVKLLSSSNNTAMKQYSNEKFEIINADILKLNLNKVIGSRKYKVVANIPYHITSKILELFLSREHKPELMVLLVQKEVAERICAPAGEMSVLSVSVQLYGKPEIVGIVPKESFFPSPKVDSAILKVDRIQITDNTIDEKSFFRLVRIGFASRRKTLANNLMAGYHLERNKVIDIIKKMKMKETVRAQELSIAQWKILEGAIKDVD